MRRRLTKALLGFLILSCASALAQDGERSLTILMGEMFFQVEGAEPGAEIALEALTQYRILFVNAGQEVHRAKFGRGVTTEGGAPGGYEENLFDGVFTQIRGFDGGASTFRIVTDRLIELDLEPGEELEVVFTFPRESRGTWEVGCFVPGHYEAGMFAPVTVR